MFSIDNSGFLNWSSPPPCIMHWEDVYQRNVKGIGRVLYAYWYDLNTGQNLTLICWSIGVWGGGGAGGGRQLPPQIRANSGWNSGKQWVKFGQSKKKKSVRESYKLQINPFGMWMMTSHRQCPRGGGACGYLCKISGKSTPLPPPLTKAFPYAYVLVYSVIARDDLYIYIFSFVQYIPNASKFTFDKVSDSLQ